jgi:hypothetical protein
MTCQSCQTREGTETWVEEGVLGFVHGFSARWCKVCVLTAQIEHATKLAAKLPELQRRLDALLIAETQQP